MWWRLKPLFCRHKWVFNIAWDDACSDGKRREVKIESCSKCHKYRLRQTVTEQKR